MTENMPFLRLNSDVPLTNLVSSHLSIPQEAQCVVGTVSIHPLKALPIGSPNRKRWLGEKLGNRTITRNVAVQIGSVGHVRNLEIEQHPEMLQ